MPMKVSSPYGPRELASCRPQMQEGVYLRAHSDVGADKGAHVGTGVVAGANADVDRDAGAGADGHVDAGVDARADAHAGAELTWIGMPELVQTGTWIQVWTPTARSNVLNFAVHDVVLLTAGIMLSSRCQGRETTRVSVRPPTNG